MWKNTGVRDDSNFQQQMTPLAPKTFQNDATNGQNDFPVVQKTPKTVLKSEEQPNP